MPDYKLPQLLSTHNDIAIAYGEKVWEFGINNIGNAVTDLVSCSKTVVVAEQ